MATREMEKKKSYQPPAIILLGEMTLALGGECNNGASYTGGDNCVGGNNASSGNCFNGGFATSADCNTGVVAAY